jgi:hypothetical protein
MGDGFIELKENVMDRLRDFAPESAFRLRRPAGDRKVLLTPDQNLCRMRISKVGGRVGIRFVGQALIPGPVRATHRQALFLLNNPA